MTPFDYPAILTTWLKPPYPPGHKLLLGTTTPFIAVKHPHQQTAWTVVAANGLPKDYLIVDPQDLTYALAACSNPDQWDALIASLPNPTKVSSIPYTDWLTGTITNPTTNQPVFTYPYEQWVDTARIAVNLDHTYTLRYYGHSGPNGAVCDQSSWTGQLTPQTWQAPANHTGIWISLESMYTPESLPITGYPLALSKTGHTFGYDRVNQTLRISSQASHIAHLKAFNRYHLYKELDKICQTGPVQRGYTRIKDYQLEPQTIPFTDDPDDGGTVTTGITFAGTTWTSTIQLGEVLDHITDETTLWYKPGPDNCTFLICHTLNYSGRLPAITIHQLTS